MATNFNGIVLNGKFYKAEEQDIQICCECDLYEECIGFPSYEPRRHDALLGLCLYFGKENIFRFSPKLTEKINR